MGCVRRLSAELANQIAAGEVVERPASIVKELVENALDAGATRVVVDVVEGGTALVRVSDDGAGMDDEDAVLALERHATSKIEAASDLFALRTFGFRGEALPSIASVSRLTLRTRARGAAEGVTVRIDGGAAPVIEPSGGAVGTTVEVRDLFYNVPARRKFLKATATESAHVGDVVLGAALARPDVTFVLSRDGRVVREYLRAATREERARAASPGETLVSCRGERGAVRIEAALGPPERARAGTTGLSVLVNGRPVKDRMLARAIAQAYGSVLEGGRYPVGVVWLDVPPEVVDVNVHPQKAEVRFADARGLFDAVTRELHASLARSFGLPALGAHPMAPQFRPPPPSPREPAAFVGDGLGPPTPREGGVGLFGETSLFDALLPLREDALPLGGSLYGRLRYMGQAHGTFLVCEGEDGLFVLDQHAAAERVTFDRLRRAHAERTVAMQRLLVPEIVELSETEVARLVEHETELARLGVEARAVGPSSVAVHAVPALLARAVPARIVEDLVAELGRSAGRPFGAAVDLVLATMACHGSVRAGDAVTREEAEALLRALDEVDFAGHCPHGRPLVMRLSWSELERRVGR